MSTQKEEQSVTTFVNNRAGIGGPVSVRPIFQQPQGPWRRLKIRVAESGSPVLSAHNKTELNSLSFPPSQSTEQLWEGKAWAALWGRHFTRRWLLASIYLCHFLKIIWLNSYIFPSHVFVSTIHMKISLETKRANLHFQGYVLSLCTDRICSLSAECIVLPTHSLFSAQRKKKKGHLHHVSREYSTAFCWKKKSLKLSPLPSKARENWGIIDAESKISPTLIKCQEKVQTFICWPVPLRLQSHGSDMSPTRKKHSIIVSFPHNGR